MSNSDNPLDATEEREPSLEDKKKFHKSLKRLSSEEILHNRDSGVYGTHDRLNPSNSNWRVRIANQVLAKIPHQEALRPQWYAVWLAVAALIVAAISLWLQLTSKP